MTLHSTNRAEEIAPGPQHPTCEHDTLATTSGKPPRAYWSGCTACPPPAENAPVAGCAVLVRDGHVTAASVFGPHYSQTREEAIESLSEDLRGRELVVFDSPAEAQRVYGEHFLCLCHRGGA